MGGPLSQKRKTYAWSNLDEFEIEATPSSDASLRSVISKAERQHCLDEGGLFYLGNSGEKAVYFPTLLSIGSLFTISSDKRPWAQVPVKIPIKGRGIVEGKCIRGKLDDTNPEAYGQLDTFDLRVFVAAVKLWEDLGFPVIRDTKSTLMLGKVVASKYSIAKQVFPNIKTPGRDHFRLIENSIMNLNNRPFCVTYKNGDGVKRKLKFKLLGDFTILTAEERGKSDVTSIMLLFSAVVTEQFRKQRFLLRSLETISGLKSEVAKLAFFYLEPKLISLKNRERGEDLLYSRMLLDFIHDLGLPPAGWQKFASTRYRFLKEVTDSMNGKPCSKEGFCVRIELRKVDDDYKLVSWLEKVEAPAVQQIPEASPPSPKNPASVI